MNHVLVIVAFAATIVVSTPYLSWAQEQEVIAGGEIEFQRNCASCHGEEGKGDGPMAKVLTIKPADLTKLSERNKGTFPFWQVYSIIDGRESIRGHGAREMPIWGDRFQQEAGGDDIDARSLVAGRILGLVFYLRQIQEE